MFDYSRRNQVLHVIDSKYSRQDVVGLFPCFEIQDKVTTEDVLGTNWILL